MLVVSSSGLEAKLEKQSAFAVAFLGHVAFGTFTKLEQAKSIAVSLLVERAGMVVTVLFDDAKVTFSTLQKACGIAIAQLAENGVVALQTLEKSVKEETVGNGLFLFWRGALNADRDAARDRRIRVSRGGYSGERQGDQRSNSRALKSRNEEHEFNLSKSTLRFGF